MPSWKADDGTLLHYSVIDNGQETDTLLLLHGLLGSAASQWWRYADELARDFRVIAIDLRGHGRSENMQPRLALNRLASDLNEFIFEIEPQRLFIAGFDLGGYLALMLALRQPRLLSALIIHGAKLYWTPKAVESVSSKLDPDLLAENNPVYADRLVKEHGANRWRALVRQASDLLHEVAGHAMIDRDLKEIHTPVLISVGDRDELVSVAEAYRLSKALPRGSLLVLPGVRHAFQTTIDSPILPVMRTFFRS